MRRSPLVAAVAVVALLVGAALSGTTARRAAAVRAATAPVTAATVVCPDVTGSPVGTRTTAAIADVAPALTPPSQSSGTVSARPLTGAHGAASVLRPAPATALSSHGRPAAAIGVTGSGTVAATLVADQVALTGGGRFRALTGVRCEPPATDWWFAGADGRVGYTDTLIVSNPTTTDAETAVQMWGDKGPLSPPHLDALRVPAMSRVVVPIATVAPDAADITVHVHATSGAVAAALLDRRTSGVRALGGDWLPVTAAPARTQLVSGFPAGNGTRYLFIGNPGAVDAAVSLRLITTSGSFAPAGSNQLVVRAGRTTAVDLTKPMSRSTGAVALSSDQPVVAQGVSAATLGHKLPDLAWQAAGRPLTGAAGLADGTEPDGGSCLLLLTAPQAGGQVRLTVPGAAARTLSVPAGRSVSVDITAQLGKGHGPHPFVVAPVSGGAVYATRVLTFAGAHGALETSEPLTPLPAPLPLPSVHEDPRAAVR